MGHVTRDTGRTSIDIDTRAGRVFTVQRWQYQWLVSAGQPLWHQRGEPAVMRLVALLPILVAACGQDAPAAGAGKNARAAPVRPAAWDTRRCGDFDIGASGVKGVAPETAVNAYGQPSGDERFRVGEPGGIYYGALDKMPPGRAHPDKGRPARVLVWTRRDCELHVFFVQRAAGWSAVQGFEAAAGADF